MAKPQNPKLVLEFAASVTLKLPPDIPEHVMRAWIEHKGALGEALRTTLLSFPVAAFKKKFLKVKDTTNLKPVKEFSSKEFFVTEHQPNGIRFSILPISNFHHFNEEDIRVADLEARVIESCEAHTRTTMSEAIMCFGGEEGAETNIAHIAQLIARQPQGEEGFLRTDGHDNCFFSRGADGKLYIVFFRWLADGRCWEIGAYGIMAKESGGEGMRFYGYVSPVSIQ